MIHFYALKYRPAGLATCPDGWTLIETGTGGFYPLRTDLPRGGTRFGVIAYKRPLTDDEVVTYELVSVPKGGAS